MPSNDYTSPGSYSWTAPFATRNVTARVIGGGASGYRDCDGDDEGGGGGGGGYAEQTRQVNAGTTLSISVASGGSSPSCDTGRNGGTSQITGGPINVRATGGRTGTDDSGGGGGGAGSAGDIVRNGGSGDDDDRGQDGGGAGNSGGNSGRCGSARGGRGTNLSGNAGSCPGGRSGAAYGAGGAGNDGGSAGAGAKGGARIVWDYHPPSITQFTVGNNYNTDANPDANVSMSWNTNYANSVSISSVGSVGASGTTTVNTGLQSNANGTSPAQKSYTLTATGPGGTVTSTKTANVKNDNTPSNAWTTSFTNLDPNTQVTVSLGTLQGVDMPTTISTSGSGNFIGRNGSFGGSINFNAGDVVQFRTTSMPFNTTVPASGTFGSTNSKTATVTTPGGSFTVTFTTRAPRVKEDFDYANNVGKYPYEDIDLITNSPSEYTTSAQIDADDIEIPVEVKTNNGNAQVSINNGGWQNTRSI